MSMLNMSVFNILTPNYVLNRYFNHSLLFRTRECQSTIIYNQLSSRNAHNRLTFRRLRSVIAVINIKRSVTTRKGNICAGLSTREKKLREREREREREYAIV